MLSIFPRPRLITRGELAGMIAVAVIGGAALWELRAVVRFAVAVVAAAVGAT